MLVENDSSGIQAIVSLNLVEVARDVVHNLLKKSHHSKIVWEIEGINDMSTTLTCKKHILSIRDDIGYSEVNWSLCSK